VGGRKLVCRTFPEEKRTENERYSKEKRPFKEVEGKKDSSGECQNGRRKKGTRNV